MTYLWARPDGRPDSVARETRDALKEICCHDQLLVEPWRYQLQTAARTVEQLSDAQGDSSILRSIRTLAATAARESALAARFDAELLAFSHERLRLLSAELEALFAALRGRRAEAAVHLESATDDLLDALRARLASLSEATAGDSMPHHEDYLADDAASVMRAYADRVERLLVDLRESTQKRSALRPGDCSPREIHACLLALIRTSSRLATTSSSQMSSQRLSAAP